MTRNEHSSTLMEDPLFVGATRPAMRWGVPYAALLFNVVMTMQIFLLTKNLLTLLICLPMHGVLVLLASRDARFFELGLLWSKTGLPGLLGNAWTWRASSHSHLALDPARRCGRRSKSEPIFVAVS